MNTNDRFYSIEEDCLYLRSFGFIKILAAIIKEEYRNKTFNLYIPMFSENPGEYELIGNIKYGFPYIKDNTVEYPISYAPLKSAKYIKVEFKINGGKDNAKY